MLSRLSAQLGAASAQQHAAPAVLVAGLQQLRAWLSSSAPAAAAAAASAADSDKHVIDEKSDSIVGAYTPITKRLWLQRYRWTDVRLARARERDPSAATLRKPPQPVSITYPFRSDPVTREHCASACSCWVAPACECCRCCVGVHQSSQRVPANMWPFHPPLSDRNPWGEARIGRILEDLDSLAGYVGFEHWRVELLPNSGCIRGQPLPTIPG